jgi:hypothetical protein
MSRDISDRLGTRNVPHANVHEINNILGRNRISSPIITVDGVNPKRITSDEIVTKRIHATDIYMAPARFDAGRAEQPSIIFREAHPLTGIYTTRPERAICIAYEGRPIATFGPIGVVLSDIVARNSVIDFHGATLANIGEITTNTGSYELVGDPITSVGDGTVLISRELFVPRFNGSVWDIYARIVYMQCDNLTISGATTFYARISRMGTAAMIIGAQYNKTNYCSAELSGITMSLRADGDYLVLESPGVAGLTISWQATYRVIVANM